MTIDLARDFFTWCSILNGSLLTLTILVLVFANDAVYRAHSRWFPMSKEAFNIAIYSFVGLYKVCFIVFNLVPFLAIAIID